MSSSARETIDEQPPEQQLGPFKLTRRLGSGRLGEVFLGERTVGFQQRVAIKILFAPESNTLAPALWRERRVLETLDHPGIVRLLDSGLTDVGRRFLTTEYVDGVPIDRFCAERRLPFRERTRLLLGIIDALDYAHRRLIVHANLKPANVLITPEGQGKLVDFGIASELLGAKPGAPDATAPAEDADLASDAAFLSPEQRAGERPSVATDVFALGVLARLLLTRDPAQRLPNAPDLAAILARATQGDAVARYGSVCELGSDLEAWLAGRPVAARPPGNIARARMFVLRHRLSSALAAVLVLAVALSVGGVLWGVAEANWQRTRAQSRLHELVGLTGALEGELYDSVASLHGGEPARALLLSKTHDTLRALAAERVDDDVLTLEIADGYRRLAELEGAGPSTQPPQRTESAQPAQNAPPSQETDRAQARQLLQQIPADHALYREARKRLGQLH